MSCLKPRVEFGWNKMAKKDSEMQVLAHMNFKIGIFRFFVYFFVGFLFFIDLLIILDVL